MSKGINQVEKRSWWLKDDRNYYESRDLFKSRGIWLFEGEEREQRFATLLGMCNLFFHFEFFFFLGGIDEKNQFEGSDEGERKKEEEGRREKRKRIYLQLSKV